MINPQKKTPINLKSLQKIRYKNQNYAFNQLFHLILSKNLFILAYKNIFLKKQTQFLINNKIRLIPIPYLIESTIKKIKKRTFTLKLININNLNNSKKLNYSQDIVIQEIISIILKKIYTPIIKANLHPIKKNKTQTSIITIKKNLQLNNKSIILFIKTKITTKNNLILIKTLSKQIKDHQFILLI